MSARWSKDLEGREDIEDGLMMRTVPAWIVHSGLAVIEEQSKQTSGTPASLKAADLGGHAKGAFTGASQWHAGPFEVANRGTMYSPRSAICQPKRRSPFCASFPNASSSESGTPKASLGR